MSAWKILNKRVVPYSQKDGTKLVYGDAVTISIELPTPHQEGDRYVLGIDWEAAPYPPSRPLCAGSQLFTVDGGILTFSDVQTGTSRFREWICRQRKPAPVHVQIVRLRGSAAETLLLDDLLALPSVIDGEITVIEGDPLADLLGQKLDRPAVSGGTGDVLRMGDGLPVWGAWPQADWEESDSGADAFIQNKPEIPSKVSQLDNDLHFVTEADVSTTLEGYVTDAELSDALEAYPTKEDVSTTLEGYVTDAELSDALTSYPTRQDLSETLESYPTRQDLSETLESYPTRQDLSETLESYPTRQDLSETLESYPTRQDLSETLESYPTRQDLSETLSGYVQYDDLSDALSGYVTDADLSDALAGKMDAPTGGNAGDVLTKTATGQAWQTVDTECYAYNLPIDTVADEAFAESDSVSVSFAAWDPGDMRVAVIPFTGTALAFPEFSTSEAANRLRTVELWFKQRAGAGAISPIATPPGCHVAGSNFPSILEADSDSSTPYTYHIYTARFMPNGSATPYELAYQHSWPTSADIGGGPGDMCLTLENRTTGWPTQIRLDKSVSSMADRNIEYSTDGGWTWTQYTWDSSTGQGAFVVVPKAGGKVCWRGVNASIADSGNNYLHFVIGSGNQFVAYGSVTSLLDGDGSSRDAGTTKYSLCGLFNGTLSLQDASGLLMPTTMGNTYQCYQMFKGCTALTAAPALPATSLQGNCYDSMFRDCTSLTTAPALPATSLQGSCYAYMFYGCTSLVTAPVLPADTLASSCYQAMFSGCTALTAAPALPVATLAEYCYKMMFSGCTSLTTAPVLPATTLQRGCYSSMFGSCASLVNAPELPATTLAYECYSTMFSGCASLVNAPALSATKLAGRCYQGMFSGCTSLTTAPYLPGNWTNPSLTEQEAYKQMFYGCTSLSSIRVEITSWSSSGRESCWQWVRDVAATGTFTCPADLPESYGWDNIPSGWTVVKI